jgi:uncharacterized RDD family membrane protein YckC
MQTIRVTTPQNIDIDFEIAGLGERILARLIDMGIFIFVLIAGVLILSSSNLLEGTHAGVIIMAIIYICLFVFYDLVCEIFMNGQSVGKRVMKIKVISLDGGRPRFGQYLMRWLFRIVDFTLTFQLCSLACAAINEKSQRLGDIVAGTILIRTSPRTKISNVVFMPATDGYEPVFKEAAQLNDGDAELIHEVINNYIKTGNSVVVYNMALRIKEHLAITLPGGMNDMQFLQTVIKDYNYLIAQIDVL